MQLDLSQLRELLAALDQTDITELTLKGTDFELTVRRRSATGEQLSPGTGLPPTSGESYRTGADFVTEPAGPRSVPSPPHAAPEVTQTPPSASMTVPSLADKQWVEITSPMVGTFYRASAPDEPPFVEVGDRIKSGQTVCIIEAMKTMNELESEVTGEVVDILVQNGEPVEYDQPLLRIKPS